MGARNGGLPSVEDGPSSYQMGLLGSYPVVQNHRSARVVNLLQASVAPGPQSGSLSTGSAHVVVYLPRQGPTQLSLTWCALYATHPSTGLSSCNYMG
jgi:hypothetical protein